MERSIRRERVGRGRFMTRAVASVAVAMAMVACAEGGPTTAPVAKKPTGAVLAIGSDSTTGATIESDKDDYVPGEVVHISGRGWSPNEVVNLYMTEEPDTHGPVTLDVTADATGAFSVHFYDVQIHDIGSLFTLTATGAISGSKAVVQFTDGRNVSAITLTPGSPVAPATNVSVDLEVVLNNGTGAKTWLGTRWAIVNASNSVVLSSSPSCIDSPDHSSGDADESNGNKHHYSFSFTAPAAGAYTLRVGVYSTDNCALASDSTGGNTQFVVQSTNTAPSATFNAPTPVNEGSPITLSLTNPADDQTPVANLQYAFDCGTGSGYSAFSGTSTASCPTTDNGTRTVKGKVKDGGSLETEYTSSVTINNVAPSATAIVASPNSVNLGGTFTISLTSPTDPSSVDAPILQYAFDCGSGSGFSAYSTTNSASCTGTTLNSQTVKGKVRDKEGAESAEYTTSVAVANVPPDGTIGGPYTLNEGSTISLAATGNDTDGGNVTFAWSFTTPNSVCQIAAPSSATSQVTCTNDGTWTIHLVITDDEGATKELDTEFKVNNVKPVVTLTGPTTANEGETKSYSYSFTDPGSDSWTHAASCGANGALSNDTFNAGTKSGSFNCTWPDNYLSQTVSITVNDDDDAGADTKSVAVANVAPTVVLTSPATSVNEGATTTYAYTTTDPGTGDTFTHTASCASGIKSNDSFDQNTGNGSFQCKWNDDASGQVVSIEVTDDDGDSDDDKATVTVANVKPVVTLTGSSSANEGDTKDYSFTFTDPGADTWSATTSCGANGVKSNETFSSAYKQGSFSCFWDNDHAGESVSAVVTDDDGGSGNDAISVNVANVVPVVTLSGPTAANEGDTKSFTYGFTDPGSDSWTPTVSCGANGTASNQQFSASQKSGSFDCNWVDDYASAQAVKAQVADDDANGSDTRNVVVSNVKPTITSLVQPVAPVQVGTPVNVTVNFTDPAGGNDAPYKAYVKWDDDLSSNLAGTIVSGGTISRTFTVPGVYTVCVQVEDDYPAKSDEVCTPTYLVVYDPNGGFVTGGGWIDSKPGAYRPDANLFGKATFGFVSKYNKGATVPSGNTEFQFHAGGMNFKSSSYQWLVVNQNGSNAQFKGNGTINGTGSYTFMLWATDASPDKFRIQITDDNNANAVVYDNNGDQAINGGSISVKAK